MPLLGQGQRNNRGAFTYRENCMVQEQHVIFQSLPGTADTCLQPSGSSRHQVSCSCSPASPHHPIPSLGSISALHCHTDSHPGLTLLPMRTVTPVEVMPGAQVTQHTSSSHARTYVHARAHTRARVHARPGLGTS